MTHFSIIIPVFNSASCLQRTVQGVTEAISKLNKPYELILIDDGSQDNSWAVIKQLQTENKNVNGIRLSKNYGQHNALLCGLNNAKGEFIITMDDDLEQQPGDISLLYDKLMGGDFDLVYGIPSNRRKGIVRSVLTYLYKRSSRVENKNADKGSSFRIFKKSLLDNLITHTGALFFMDEIALWYTDKIEYVPVAYKKSLKTNSGYGYSSLFTLSLRVLSLSSTMPLRLVRVLGFYIAGFSTLLGLYFFMRKFFHKVPVGYTSIIVTILFSTGIIMVCLGIIGEYLGNLIALSNKKPSYSVKEKI